MKELLHSLLPILSGYPPHAWHHYNQQTSNNRLSQVVVSEQIGKWVKWTIVRSTYQYMHRCPVE